MAHYPLRSAKEVLANVARNTGGKLPSGYNDDILEWLPEGIDLLTRTPMQETTSTPDINSANALYTQNHVVCLPKDLGAILAVEDEFGKRLSEGGDITDITSQTTVYHTGNESTAARATVFEVNPLDHQTSDGTPTTQPGTSIPLYGSDLTQTNNTVGQANYYKVSGNHLQTNFECGFVRIHYLRRPIDAEGYPLIPDNQNLRSALYWYVLMMLIGAGYQHPVFTYEKCESQFELYGARAIGEITYPTFDEMARLHRSFIRLVPPDHFERDFFIGSEQSQSTRL